MNRAPNSIASTAFRGGVLYVQVSTPENILGNIYAVNDPNASRGGRGGTNGISNTLYYTLQTVHGLHNFTVPGNQNLVSMVSGTTIGNSIPNGIRHDIFLAFTPSGASTAPVLVRLQPSSTGPVSVSNTDWILYQDEGGIQSPVLAPVISSMAQIASGQKDLSSTPYSTSVEAEGSAIYEIYWNSLSTGDFQLQKVDMSTLGTPSDPTSSPAITVLWVQTFSLLDSISSPKLLRLSDGGYFDGVVIGKCAGSSQTCLVFFNDSNNPSMTTALQQGRKWPHSI
ncbi:hypothetical protein BGZ79_002699 [Entomortierella chlamydospora]|nr:hypothetical protein BGZ79_002699 [Entomortierella chlamydospora]